MKYKGIAIICVSLLGFFPVLSQVDSVSLLLQTALDFQSERSHEKASQLLQEIIDEYLSADQHDSVAALVYHRLGVSHYLLRHRQDAIVAWNEAIRIRKTFLPANHIDIVKTYINIANAYLTLHQYTQATESLLQALELLNTQAQRDLHNLGRVYESLGMVSRLTGDMQSAEEYLLQSYQIKGELYPDQPGQLINITTRLFDVYKDLENPDKMLQYARLNMNQVLASPYDDVQQQIDLANAHNNLGVAYIASTQDDSAIYHLENSLQINTALQDRDLMIAFGYNNLILPNSRKGRFERALDYSQQAIDIFSQDPAFAVYLAETLIEAGDLYRTQENYKAALELYQKAIDQKCIDRELIDITQNPDPDDLTLGNRSTLMDALYKKGLCLEGLTRYTEAAATCGSLLNFVQDQRLRISDRNSKNQLLKSSRDYYELAVRIQYRQFELSEKSTHIERAISYLNASRSMLLFDALTENQITDDDPLIKSLIDRERDLYRQIGNLEEKIWLSDNTAVMAKSRDTILQHRASITQLRDSIFPFVSQLHSGANSNLHQISFLRDHLVDSLEVLIEYFVGSDEVYVISLDDKQYSFHCLGASNELRTLTERYLNHLKNAETPVADYSQNAMDLSQFLLSPVLPAKNHDKVRIIPDDILATVPFEALISPNAKGDPPLNYHDAEYLVRDYVLGYAASIPVLMLQKSTAREKGNRFLGMASDYRNLDTLQLASMHHALEEVRDCKEIIGGDLILNADATRENFLQKERQYQIIHLSLHGSADDQNPGLSYLQFYPTAGDVKAARLHAIEIYNQSIPSQLMVLSACQTGSGVLSKGEGIQSLGHAFAYAGSKSILMSLWHISSRSTAEILQYFYQDLSSSGAQDQALSTAKLQYLDNTRAPELAHPFYWAALVQSGDPFSVVPANRLSFIWVWVAGVLLVVGYFIFSRRSRASA